MSCEEVRQFLDAYMDGELDLVNTLALERHLQDCDRCRFEDSRQQELRRSIQVHTPYFKAPEGLRVRILTQIRGTRDRETSSPGARTWPSWGWSAMAAGIAVLVLISATLLAIILKHPSPNQLIADQVVASHIRSLMVDHLNDVTSSDQHTVKPWFSGKLDFAPTVKDLGPNDFPLIGGRLDYLDGKPVAAIVYKRHQHTINLFLWPSPTRTSKIMSYYIKGYNLIHWNQANMTYWAISDLNLQELTDFVHDQQG
jgi:anti-sigma factor (TIGR02949 family)